MANTVDDARILAALGIVAATDGQEGASPAASKAGRGASDAKSGVHPEKQPGQCAHEDAALMAEMGSRATTRTALR